MIKTVALPWGLWPPALRWGELSIQSSFSSFNPRLAFLGYVDEQLQTKTNGHCIER